MPEEFHSCFVPFRIYDSTSKFDAGFPFFLLTKKLSVRSPETSSPTDVKWLPFWINHKVRESQSNCDTIHKETSTFFVPSFRISSRMNPMRCRFGLPGVLLGELLPLVVPTPVAFVEFLELTGWNISGFQEHPLSFRLPYRPKAFCDRSLN